MALFGTKKTNNNSKTMSVKTEKKEVKKQTVKVLIGQDPEFTSRILIKPLVTEKTTKGEEENKYVFEVAKSANKIEIKKAIFKLYGFKPTKVNIVKTKGKNVRYGKTQGTMKGIKKAIITLKKEEKIDISLNK